MKYINLHSRVQSDSKKIVNRKNLWKKITFLVLFLFIVSCATPTVVNIIGPNDNELNCSELNVEIAKANQYADEAQKAKKLVHPTI